MPIARKILLYIVIAAIGVTGAYLIYDKYFKSSELVKVNYAQARVNMIERQLKARNIMDEKVLRAMENVPRHKFVIDKYKSSAYEDSPLPIGYGQTISQPYIVAFMTQSLELTGDEKILEIGTGSGYQSAVLDEIVDEVYSIEIIDKLAERSRKTLGSSGYEVKVKNADGYYGWPEYAPFDAIMITAATNHIPPPLFEQLKDGGNMIMPLGGPFVTQTLTLIYKDGQEKKLEHIAPVRFVPMTGKAQKKEIED